MTNAANAVAVVEALSELPTIGKEKGKDNQIILKRLGNDSTYLARRLKRDAPTVFEKLKAGEFTSVRGKRFQ